MWKFAAPGSVLGKALMVGLIVLLLMIPLAMLKDLVSERAGMREQAYATVAQGWGGDVVTGAPMLVVPVDRHERNDKGVAVPVRRNLYVLPTRVDIEVQLIEQPDRRRVGIYEVPVYLAHVKMKGEFAANAASTASSKVNAEATFHFARAQLRVPLSDARTLRELSLAQVNARAATFEPARPGVYGGIETDIDLAAEGAHAIPFEFEMTLAGSRDLSILPIAGVTNVHIASAWPDPKFSGAFLPVERTIDASGFNARWQVLELNRNFGQSWIDCDLESERLAHAAFGVELFQSVDVYQRSERAVKYALLFIALTFLSFFVWETLVGVAVHPIQYFLIGLALSMFYLLLIALTEHIPFVLAYWIASGALTALLTVYTASALRGFSRGVAVGGAMALTYGVLFMLILSEQYALLMGAIVLFVALAVLMMTTRRVQW